MFTFPGCFFFIFIISGAWATYLIGRPASKKRNICLYIACAVAGISAFIMILALLPVQP